MKGINIITSHTITFTTQVKIYKEIEELQPMIKELYKNNRYCDGIEKRSIDIQDNIDNFDKDIGISNEKDNIKTQY